MNRIFSNESHLILNGVIYAKLPLIIHRTAETLVQIPVEIVGNMVTLPINVGAERGNSKIT